MNRQVELVRSLVVSFVTAATLVVPIQAAVTTTALRETVEYVTKKFSREAAEEGTDLLTRKVEQLATKHGDDALVAMKNVGPRALRAVDEAGPRGAEAVRAMARFGDDGLEYVAKRPKNLELAAKYGDDAVEAIVKHKEVAEPLITEMGAAGAKALRAVGPQEGRRLAMMAADPATAAIVRDPKLLDVVARYGDRGMKFVWDHKGALAVGSVLTAFLADPQPFIDGTRDLAQVAGETLVNPIVTEAAKSFDWTLLGLAFLTAAALLIVWSSFLRHRLQLRRGPR
ncbi:MAG: hypothetical protein JNL96_26465 [Planctomycetaceae bacterium]|nr:hypothetical protein [Planctomycetaceae bacterium]